MADRPVIEVGDTAGNMLGQLSSWDNLTMVHRGCDVGSGALDVPAPTVDDVALLAAGSTIQVSLAGRVLQFGYLRQAAGSRDESGGSVNKPSWWDPMCLLNDWAFPNPRPVAGQESFQAGQGPAEFDMRTGYATSVILGLVDDNVGPSAIPWRRAPGVRIAPDPQGGAYIDSPVASRWNELLPLLRGIAIPAGAAFGFSTFDRTHTFWARQVVDRSGLVVFSHALSNLGAGEWSVTAPQATRVIALGPYDGVDRLAFLVYTEESTRQEARWGRAFPVVMDSSTKVAADPALGITDDDALRMTVDAVRAEAERKLAEQGETVSAQFDILDGTWQFGVDYFLNDLVGLEVDGLPGRLVLPVREVTDKWTAAGGRKVTPVVGDYGATSSTAAAVSARDVARTLAALQSRR